jgi:uncharacterized protein YfaP (DUF2135 family)
MMDLRRLLPLAAALAAGCVPQAPGGPRGSACAVVGECGADSTCYFGTCVGEGALRISLRWTASVDFDLHVLTPNGWEVYYANPRLDGAQLDVDDCIAEDCREPTGTHVENIYFSESPPLGAYSVWAENYDGAAAGDFTIETSLGDTMTGTLPAESGTASEALEFIFRL